MPLDKHDVFGARLRPDVARNAPGRTLQCAWACMGAARFFLMSPENCTSNILACALFSVVKNSKSMSWTFLPE